MWSRSNRFIGTVYYRGCKLGIVSSVETIKSWAFAYCDNLATIYYNGTSADWEEIFIEEDSFEETASVTIHYNDSNNNDSSSSDNNSSSGGGNSNNNNTSDGDETVNVDYTVSETEWEDAFSISGLSNVTIKAYLGNVIFTQYIIANGEMDVTLYDSNGNVEEHEVVVADEVNLDALVTNGLGELFSQFVYDENSKSYKYIGTDTTYEDVEIKFSNGKVDTVSASGFIVYKYTNYGTSAVS